MDSSVLLVGGAVLVLVVTVLPALGRRRAARELEERDARLRQEAAAAGLRYGATTIGHGGPSGPPDAGAFTRVFSGTSAMMSWTAEVEADADRPGPRRRNRRVERTRITFPAVRAAPGRFVFAMALPPGARAPEIPTGDGFVARLAARAAEGILDLYVGGYFGPRHRALVNVEGADRPAAPAGFFVLSTDAAAATRLVAPDAAAVLEGLRDAVPGQPSFGVLVSAEGLTWAMPSSVREATALKALAERVAALAARLRA